MLTVVWFAWRLTPLEYENDLAYGPFTPNMILTLSSLRKHDEVQTVPCHATHGRSSPVFHALRIHPLLFSEMTSTGRFKSFIKRYGAVGIGTYLALSVVDLSLTMAAIQIKGADRIMELEDRVWATIKGTETTTRQREQQPDNKKPSWTTVFLLAYGIHKTILLPFRISLTAAITPPLTKRLHQLGWIHKKP